MCDGARVCCWAVLQLSRVGAACTEEYFNTLDESGKSLLGKHVMTSGEGSLDPRFYINFYQSLAERLEGVDYH